MTAEYKYWAFISYSHADARWADWLHKSLERYRIPARLVGRTTATGTVPKKLFPVFRDRDELAGSSELGSSLQDALRQSRFQIVIASANSARSRWVGEEIRYFKSLGRSSRVLALIVDGEPNATDKGQPELECFAEALRFQVAPDGSVANTPAEQVAADARKHADGKNNALLKLIAGLLGVGFDELRQRELQARNRRLAALASVATAVSAVTVVLAIFAYNARNDAVRRQQQAEDLLQFMLGDLRDKLEPIGKLSILDAVGKKGMEYFATLDQRDLTDSGLSSRAKALRQIGDLRIKQGDLKGASESFGEALRLDEELARRHPKDTALLSNMAKSEYTMGEAHYVKGELEQALAWWQRQAATAQRLLELEPDSPEWSHDYANAHMNLGALELNRNKLDEAQVELEIALARQKKLVDRNPAQLPYFNTLSSIYGWLHNLELARRNWSRAIEHGERSAATLRRMTELAPDNVPYQYMLANANLQALFAQNKVEPVAPDTDVLRETLQLTKTLVALDPENLEYAQQRVIALNYLANAHLNLGHWHAAEGSLLEGLELARSNFQRAPDSSEISRTLLGALAQSARFDWLQKNSASARARIQEARSLPLSPDQKKVSVLRMLDLALLEWSMARRPADIASARTRTEALLADAKAAGIPDNPEFVLRYEALRGNRAEARRQFGGLPEQARNHPFMRHFCRSTAVCVAPPAQAAGEPAATAAVSPM